MRTWHKVFFVLTRRRRVQTGYLLLISNVERLVVVLVVKTLTLDVDKVTHT